MQVITSRLKELGYEASNVQVITQGKGDDATMFLVNESGVIKITNCMEVIGCCTDQGASPIIEMRSAL